MRKRGYANLVNYQSKGVVEAKRLGYKFFNFWKEIKFLGLQSMNFYILSISTLIFYSETKKSWRTQYVEIFHSFDILF